MVPASSAATSATTSASGKWSPQSQWSPVPNAREIRTWSVIPRRRRGCRRLEQTGGRLCRRQIPARSGTVCSTSMRRGSGIGPCWLGAAELGVRGLFDVDAVGVGVRRAPCRVGLGDAGDGGGRVGTSERRRTSGRARYRMTASATGAARGLGGVQHGELNGGEAAGVLVGGGNRQHAGAVPVMFNCAACSARGVIVIPDPPTGQASRRIAGRRGLACPSSPGRTGPGLPWRSTVGRLTTTRLDGGRRPSAGGQHPVVVDLPTGGRHAHPGAGVVSIGLRDRPRPSGRDQGRAALAPATRWRRRAHHTVVGHTRSPVRRRCVGSAARLGWCRRHEVASIGR